MHESIVLSFFRPACIAHTVAILLHGYWAIYDPLSTSLWYAIHHIILLITMSCKGQDWPLHNIALTNIVWCVYHTKGGSGEARTLHSSRAILLQQCGLLHNIAITNIVWCTENTKRVGGGGVPCTVVVRSYCNSVGLTGGRGNTMVIGSFTKTLN